MSVRTGMMVLLVLAAPAVWADEYSWDKSSALSVRPLPEPAGASVPGEQAPETVPAAARPRGWQWSAAVGGGARWFDWREYQNEQQLLVESGPLLTGEGELRLAYDNVYGSVQLSVGGGQAQYDGQLLSGQPYVADAEEEVLDAEWQLGWQDSTYNAHLGLMNRYWHRYVNGSATVVPAEEEYRWLLATLGGGWHFHRSPSWQMALNVDVGVPLHSEQEVISPIFGTFNLEPGAGLYWRVAFPLSRGNLQISPYLQYQQMDKSNSVIRQSSVNGLQYSLHQPESQRLDLGLSLLWYVGGTARAFPGN